jgi:hypothetical protein
MHPPTTATATRIDDTVKVEGNQTGSGSVDAVIELGVTTSSGFDPKGGDDYRIVKSAAPGATLAETFVLKSTLPAVTHCRISRKDDPASFVVIPISDD